MILQGRNLTQGLTGPDVAALHAQLAELGYTVPATEVQANQFGAGTLAAVEQAQAAAGLTANGAVDAATASALDVLIRASTFAVSGHVTSTVSAGTAGLSVRLVDKNVGGDIVLATATTDAAGAYSFSRGDRRVDAPVTLQDGARSADSGDRTGQRYRHDNHRRGFRGRDQRDIAAGARRRLARQRARPAQRI